MKYFRKILTNAIFKNISLEISGNDFNLTTNVNKKNSNFKSQIPNLKFQKLMDGLLILKLIKVDIIDLKLLTVQCLDFCTFDQFVCFWNFRFGIWDLKFEFFLFTFVVKLKSLPDISNEIFLKNGISRKFLKIFH